MPTPTEFFRWWVTDDRTAKRRLTTYKMTRAQAANRYPGAEPDPQTREVRHLPEPGEVHGSLKPPAEKVDPAAEGPRLSSCAFCEGSGWVCADHPALPFEHDDCCAEGSPWVCNPAGAVPWQHVYAETPPDGPPQ
jgi:hypothetical protein